MNTVDKIWTIKDALYSVQYDIENEAGLNRTIIDDELLDLLEEVLDAIKLNKVLIDE